jgi:uncharacterized protein (TIGR02453 family)
MIKTLNFLSELKENNNKPWFEENKSRFVKIKEENKIFFESVFNSLNEIDSIENFKIFRIYRDVRFSKNKTPYKTNFGVSFKRTKPELRGGYYFHLEPNNTFIACGFWDPNKEDLLRIRKEIELDGNEFRDVTNLDSIKSVWGEMKGDQLKTAPRGFDKKDSNIDLLRFKQFIFTKNIDVTNITQDKLKETIIESYGSLRPFFDYMSDVLTTNLNGESML